MQNRHVEKYTVETWDITQLLFSAFNDHQIHCVIRLSGRVDEARLRLAVDRLAEIFPLLRSRFTERSGAPAWEDAGFTARDMVFCRGAENPGDEAARLICQPTDERAGPQIKLYLLRGVRDDLLCVVINHMLCDGAGFKELLYLLCALYSNPEASPADYPRREDIVRDARIVLRQFEAKERLKIYASRYGLSRHNDSILLDLEGDRQSPFIATHVIPANRFLAAKAYAKARGATVNDVMLAAYLRALQKLLPGKTTAIQCILDLRKYLPAPAAPAPALFCNLTSNLVCDIGSEVGADFDDTLLKVKRVMDDEKSSVSCLNLIALLEAIRRILPYPVFKKAVLRFYRNPPLAMSNIGVIDRGRLVFGGAAVVGAYITGSIKYRPFFQLALSTFGDEVTLSAAFHGTPDDRRRIGNLLRLTADALPR